MKKMAEDTPANYGRWDTFSGTIKVTSTNTPEQQKIIDEINALRAAERENNAISEMDEAEAKVNYLMCIDNSRARKALGYELAINEENLLLQAELEGIEASYPFAKHLAKKLYPEVNYCTEHFDAYVFSDKNNIGFGGNSPVVILKKTGEAINMTAYLDSNPGEKIREFDVNGTDYPEAKQIALNLLPRVNSCREYSDAFYFTDVNTEMDHTNGVIIMKADGSVCYSFPEFIRNRKATDRGVPIEF